MRGLKDHLWTCGLFLFLTSSILAIPPSTFGAPKTWRSPKIIKSGPRKIDVGRLKEMTARLFVPQCGACPSSGHPYDSSWLTTTCGDKDNDANHNGIPDWEYTNQGSKGKFTLTDCLARVPCDRDLDHDNIPDAQDVCVCSACHPTRDGLEPPAPGFFSDTETGQRLKASSFWCHASSVAAASACEGDRDHPDDCWVIPPSTAACGEPDNPMTRYFSSYNCICLDADGDAVCQNRLSGASPPGMASHYFYSGPGYPAPTYLGDPPVNDNCPGVANQNQLDTDGDGIGDLCDSSPTEVVAGETPRSTATPTASRPIDPFGPCPVCGNGSLESGEECDDGNTVSGDGCNSTCHLEEEEHDHAGSE